MGKGHRGGLRLLEPGARRGGAAARGLAALPELRVGNACFRERKPLAWQLRFSAAFRKFPSHVVARKRDPPHGEGRWGKGRGQKNGSPRGLPLRAGLSWRITS
jgi:hypothetical protein